MSYFSYSVVASVREGKKYIKKLVNEKNPNFNVTLDFFLWGSWIFGPDFGLSPCGVELSLSFPPQFILTAPPNQQEKNLSQKNLTDFSAIFWRISSVKIYGLDYILKVDQLQKNDWIVQNLERRWIGEFYWQKFKVTHSRHTIMI